MSHETAKEKNETDAPTDELADNQLEGASGGRSSTEPTLATESQDRSSINKTKLAIAEGKRLK
jgi:hypothetical protein